jgi:RimJ/RimL family protein N-acetyltransferase
MRLRPFDRSDFARLLGWVESPDFLFQWAGTLFNYPLDEAQLERYLLLAIGDPPTRLIYTALEGDEAVGHIEISQIDRRHNSATLSRIIIAPGRRGTGLGQQMVRLALGVVFDTLRLHRVDLFVFDFNGSAIAAYERAGLKREGHLRDIRRVGDEYWSVIQMSMLETEWKSSA